MAKFEIHFYALPDLKGLQGEYLVWIFSYYRTKYYVTYIDGIGQDCSIPNTLTLQFCTKPSICSTALPSVHAKSIALANLLIPQVNRSFSSERDITITSHGCQDVSNHRPLSCSFKICASNMEKQSNAFSLPFDRESLGERRIPLTKGQWWGNRFHHMM